MKKLMVLGAAAVGYVFGTKAGRQRYEQIKRGASRIKNDPRVQEKTQQAADLAKEKAQQAAAVALDKAPVVKEKVVGVASSAAAKIRSGHGDDERLVDQLHPDSTARQEDPYPQGDLP